MRHSERRRRLFARRAIAFLVMATAVAATAVSRTDSAPAIDTPARTDLIATAGTQAGFRVFLDADGKPTAPSPAQRNAVRSYSTAPQAPLVELDAPRGGRMLVLDGRYQSYSVARVGEDGAVSVECHRGTLDGHNKDAAHGHPSNGTQKGGSR